MGTRPWNHGGRVVWVALLALAGCVGYSLSLRPVQLVDLALAQQAGASSIEAPDTLELTGLQRKFQAIARRLAPSVVAISASITRVDSGDVVRTEEMNADKLSTILDRTTRTVGTGFIIDADGYVMTNEHVVGEAEQLWVTTDDHKVYPAIIIGSDPRADVAMLKIPAKGLPAVRFAEYNTVQRGQWTIALGNPYGLATDGQMCMSVGIISAINRSLPKLASKENRIYSNLIQTTAQINPGNSGGPLFNLDGEVIGMNTAVILPQKQTNGIGFAMPITPNLTSLIHNLKDGREIVYGYLGVMASTPTARECRSAGISQELGARIDSIEADSPAASSDLKAQDIVVQINGEVIQDSEQFVRTIGSTPIDKPAQMHLYRGGKALTVSVKLRKRQLPAVAISRQNQRLRWQGLLLGPIPANWDFGKTAKPEAGLMVLGIESTSPFTKQGIAQGAVITRIAGKAVSCIADLQKILNDTPVEACQVQLANSTGAVVSIQP